MFFFKDIRFIISVFLLLFLVFPNTLCGQDSLRYTGPYQVGIYKGEADFGYRIIDNDTVLDGPFQMQRSNLEALLEEQDYTFSFNGSFKDDYPEGDWRFQFGEFKTERESRVVNYQYRVNVSGIQHEAIGAIQKGKPDGPWSFVVDSIDQSTVDRTLFRSAIEYESGIPQKSFRVENLQYTLVGRCLRNGLAHDEWALFPNDGVGANESWFFENGILQRIRIEIDNQTTELDFYNGIDDQSKMIELDHRYLSILKLKQQSSDPDTALKSGLFELISENAKYYQKIDDILAELGESDFRPAFKVLVEHYPLSTEETSQLDSITRWVDRTKVISDSLLEDTQMNILKLSDDESAFLYAVLVRISEDFLQPLEKLVDLKKKSTVDLISRDKLFENLWPADLTSTVIEIQNIADDNERQTFSGPRAAEFSFGDKSLASAYQLAQYASLSVDSIQAVLSDKLKIEKSQQDLSVIEENLIKQSKALTQLLDSLSGTASAREREAIDKIRSLTDAELSRYAAMESIDDKLEFGQQLVVCYQNIDQLARAIGNLTAQDEEIKALYQDAIWNPFMAVIMEEEVKKRITSAYRKTVVPYLLKTVTTELDCTNADELSALFEQVYKRMLEMREEDTAKLERKLKREQDPLQILELFNVESKKLD